MSNQINARSALEISKKAALSNVYKSIRQQAEQGEGSLMISDKLMGVVKEDLIESGYYIEELAIPQCMWLVSWTIKNEQ